MIKGGNDNLVSIDLSNSFGPGYQQYDFSDKGGYVFFPSI